MLPHGLAPAELFLPVATYDRGELAAAGNVLKHQVPDFVVLLLREVHKVSVGTETGADDHKPVVVCRCFAVGSM